MEFYLFFFFQLGRGYAEGFGFLLVFGMVDVWQPKLRLGYPFVLAEVHLRAEKTSFSVTGRKEWGEVFVKELPSLLTG